MIKMLLHSDTRQVRQNNMFMYIWNVIAGFIFFICWYMLRLLKYKQSNYRKTDCESADEQYNEKDAFIGMIFVILFKRGKYDNLKVMIPLQIYHNFYYSCSSRSEDIGQK